MKNINKCENCIWCDQCAQNEVCADFTPLSFTEADIHSEEYEADLRDRVECYQELIDEQNS